MHVVASKISISDLGECSSYRFIKVMPSLNYNRSLIILIWLAMFEAVVFFILMLLSNALMGNESFQVFMVFEVTLIDYASLDQVHSMAFYFEYYCSDYCFMHFLIVSYSFDTCCHKDCLID
jgi:hypothetical protein